MVAAAVLAAAAGCGKDSDEPSGEESATPPEAAEQARAVRDSTELIGRYDAAAAAHPALAARLRPLRAEVARHIEALGGRAPAATSPPAGAAPGSRAQALAGLAAAERALADRRAAAVLALPGEAARLMASVAAAGAGHAALLGASASSGKGGE